MKRMCVLWMILGMLAMVTSVRAAEPETRGARLAFSDNYSTPVDYDGADRSTTKGPFYYQSENELRGRKLARGAGNVLLCVAEIPNQAFQEAYRTSPITGAVVGAGKGVIKGAKRLAIGLWEVATFYHPGRNYYGPIIEPEVVFMEYVH